MESKDIKLLRKALNHLQRPDLSDLLRNSNSYLDISSSFGSRLYSLISTFDIYAPPENYRTLANLSDDDKKTIYEAVLLIYPVKDNEPEIVQINYFIDLKVGENELLDTKHLSEISFDYVKEQISKCDEKINSGDFEGAVTNARNLMESVCLYIYEEISGERFPYDGNLSKLHKKVADLLKMTPELYADQNIKKILSGISSIVYGVSELRNSKSDAHGKSPSSVSYRIDQRHAILVVNLAKTVSEYLYLSFAKYQSDNGN